MSSSLLEEKLGSSLHHETTKKTLAVGVHKKLNLSDINLFNRDVLTVDLTQETPSAIKYSYESLKSFIDKRLPVYGINTNFGDQVNFLDSHLKNNSDSLAYMNSIYERQENLIKSHSCGLGRVVEKDIIRTAILLRIHCLAQGYSGVSPETITSMINFLNSGIIPVVRCYGSVGASGDLIPLAMIAACMTGEDVEAVYQNKTMRAWEALELAGLKKLQPQIRDGLAMINGTSFMTATTSIALYKLKRLFHQMLSAIAMMLESLLVIESAYHPLVHELKNHSGQAAINNMLLNFWHGSQLLSNLDELRIETANLAGSTSTSTENRKPVQDFYSIRSVCQGFGPFYENLQRAIIWIENEMNSVNDNPIIDARNQKIHHNANFMGYYVTDACDSLKMNIAQASTWLHALLANLVHPRKNHNLPANLVEDPGKYNGFRPLQLLAAALTVQNRKLAQSHQAFMLPTEGDNQDVNSLGLHAAFDFQESVDNLERLTAIALLAAVQALELRGIEKAAEKTRFIYSLIRNYSATINKCRPMTDEINSIITLLIQEKI